MYGSHLDLHVRTHSFPSRRSSDLIARDNFGCGSSREHAVWALDDYGFRAVIAPSFADIFFSNCFKNGVLPVILKPEEVQAIFEGVAKHPEASFTIDLPAQQVKLPCGNAFSFENDAGRKQNMVERSEEHTSELQS